MKKVCIICSDIQYLSWEKTGVLENLKKFFKVQILVLNSSKTFEGIGSLNY